MNALSGHLPRRGFAYSLSVLALVLAVMSAMLFSIQNRHELPAFISIGEYLGLEQSSVASSSSFRSFIGIAAAQSLKAASDYLNSTGEENKTFNNSSCVVGALFFKGNVSDFDCPVEEFSQITMPNQQFSLDRWESDYNTGPPAGAVLTEVGILSYRAEQLDSTHAAFYATFFANTSINGLPGKVMNRTYSETDVVDISGLSNNPFG